MKGFDEGAGISTEIACKYNGAAYLDIWRTVREGSVWMIVHYSGFPRLA